MARSFCETAASRRRCLTTLTETKKAAAMSSSDCPSLAQGLEGAELVERMKRDTLDVLGKRIVFGEDARRRVAHYARYQRGLGEALLLHQQGQRLIAPSAGRDLKHAGLGALGVENRPDIQALQKGAPGDVLGEFLDRDPRLDPADIGLAEDQLVEGDVARAAEGDPLNIVSHGGSP